MILSAKYYIIAILVISVIILGVFTYLNDPEEITVQYDKNVQDSLQCVIDEMTDSVRVEKEIIEKIIYRYEKIYIINPVSADSAYESIKDFRFK